MNWSHLRIKFNPWKLVIKMSVIMLIASFLFFSASADLSFIWKTQASLTFDNPAGDTINWQQIKSVNDVCNAFPARMDCLMKEIDLNKNGLQHVKAAYTDGKLNLACKYLLDYYKNGNTVPYLRKQKVAPNGKTDSHADSIMEDYVTFYLQTDEIPKLANGHLNWKYRGPGHDIEWAWALNRHYYFRDLLEAYFETGSNKYIKKIDLDLRDWIISSLPYPAVKSNTALWRGLEVSFRVKIWTQIFYGLMDCPELSDATRLLMLTSIPEHAHYLKNFHAEGNWLTMEMSGLANVATAFTELRKSPEWLAYSKKTMTQSLKKQVYADGVQTELTSHYHQVALNNFSLFRQIFKKSGNSLSPLYESQIEKMWNYLAYTMRPDGNGLLNNDSDLDYNRDKIRDAADSFARKDWLYISSNGARGIRPRGTPSKFFAWAGQLIMRSGFGKMDQWGFFDIGPWGTGHQHNDKLHLSVSAYGRDLLVDAGRFAYRGEVADKFRAYATGSFGHNVILIDGNGQSAGPLLNTEPVAGNHFAIADSFDNAWSSFDKFDKVSGSCSHTRSVFYVRNEFWVVVDKINTDKPRNIDVLWHWHPDCQVETDQSVTFSKNEKGNLEIVPVGNLPFSVSLVSGQESPFIQGWYSKEYNQFRPNTVSIYSVKIDSSSVFAWILYPAENELPAVKAKIISQSGSEVTIEVFNPEEGKWRLQVPLSDVGKCLYHYSAINRK